MAWIAGAAALIGGIAQSAAAKKDKKDSQAHDTEMSEKGAMYQRENAQFDSEMEYYYAQLGRANKQRGLDTFRNMSTVKNYMPHYVSNDPRIVLPDKPVFNKGIYEVHEDPKKQEEPFSWKKKLIQPFYRIGQFGD